MPAAWSVSSIMCLVCEASSKELQVISRSSASCHGAREQHRWYNWHDTCPSSGRSCPPERQDHMGELDDLVIQTQMCRRLIRRERKRQKTPTSSIATKIRISQGKSPILHNSLYPLLQITPVRTLQGACHSRVRQGCVFYYHLKLIVGQSPKLYSLSSKSRGLQVHTLLPPVGLTPPQ